MGDVGSVSLGFLLAVISVWIARDTHWWLLPWLGLLHANFVLDTGITMVRRAALGERWYEAHREHFYQRLIRAGQSHQRVTLSEMALQGVVLGLLIAAQPTNWTGRILAAITVLSLWTGFFLYAEYKFQQAYPERMIESSPYPRKAQL
jgi:UDP-N-acetylmuramyl pentapeptide phosphotransferase/UDP-N-acetylglucosamine-1-phosphate transferase